jgi:DNA modification methylase
MTENTLYYGDNQEVLPQHVPDESVDLIYLDPPFNSNATYNVLFAEQDGTRAAAQIKAFEDTWRWDQASVRAYQEVVEAGGRVAEVMRAFHTFLGGNDMMAYLSMMAPRLKQLHRVLKPKGGLYLHCDPTASHYLKILMDAVFGLRFFKNEIVWQRTNSHNDAGQYGRIHDIILFYVKSDSYTWNSVMMAYSPQQLKRYKPDENGRLYTGQDLTASRPDSDSGKFEWRGTRPPPSCGWGYTREQLEKWWDEGRILTKKDGKPRMDGLKVYLDEMPGKTLQSIWTDIPRIPNTSPERLGYPTQKPIELLKRIVLASSSPGDVVLDPFCGCGTTIAAVETLNRDNPDKPSRRWIGIDITHLAINLIKYRLHDSFGDACRYEVLGEPASLPDARQLAAEDPFQFQWWSLGLVKARPADEKKGADKGIDGRLYFHDEAGGAQTKQVIFSVKAGQNLNVSHVRDLRGVLDREEAQIGALISMEEPTQPMRAEAASAGFYDSPWGTKHPRIQLLTVEELLGGKKVDMPPTRDERTFKKAPKAKRAAPSKKKTLFDQDKDT